MTDLSDLFAFLYMIDLRSLRSAIEEGARILAQRERESNLASSTASSPVTGFKGGR
jgi:hypothetical protein